MIRNTVLSIILFVLLLVGVSALTPAPASAAYDLFGQNNLCSGKSGDSTVCQDKSKKGNPISGPDGLLLNITDIVAYIAGAAAIIIIIISGISYITSGGDPGKVTSAKDTLVNALIGIVVIVLARTLIVFIITKLYEP